MKLSSSYVRFEYYINIDDVLLLGTLRALLTLMTSHYLVLYVYILRNNIQC